jgi:methyl-accepting chemotaxis protein
MTLEAWLRDRGGWLLQPALLGNALALSVAVPWTSASLGLEGAAMQGFLFSAAGLAFALYVGLSWVALAGLATFRALAAGRLGLTDAARLEALKELRRFPARVSTLSFVGWAGGAAALGGLAAALLGAESADALRVGLMGLVFGPLATTVVALLVTARTQEASNRLGVGLAPHDVVQALPPVEWSARRRLVLFTLVLTVLPAGLVLDLVRAETAEAAARLAVTSPSARAAAVEAAASGLTLRLVVLGGLALLVAGLAAAAGGQAIAAPLQELTQVARRIAAGRLERPHVIAADGEVWRVTGVFAQLHERLAELVAKVLGAGAAVARATGALREASARAEVTAAEQAASLNQTSATTEELAQSARQIAQSAAAVQDFARRTLEAAEQGQADAAAFQAAVDRMTQDNRSIAAAVERLQRRVQQIGRIVELINTVADRSDLLALSAELEGTRAGEVGRGFSLVGAEMRRLAENVLESTAEVDELIAEIRDATLRTAEATARGSSLTERGTSLARGVTASLTRVAELARDTSTEVRTITLSTQQQQSSTDQLAEAMADILTGTQQELATTQRAAEVNRRLVELGRALEGVVGRFRERGEDDRA